MKKLLISTGVLIILFGLFQGSKYWLDNAILTDYGKGYIWGSALLLMFGLFLIISGLRRKIGSK